MNVIISSFYDSVVVLCVCKGQACMVTHTHTRTKNVLRIFQTKSCTRV